jgi:thiol-activated cytolysin
MKVKRMALFLISVVLAGMLLFTSCQQKTPTVQPSTSPTVEPTNQPTTQPTQIPTTQPTPTPPTETIKTQFTTDEKASIRNIVIEAGKIIPAAAEKDEITSTETKEEGDYRNTYEKHDVVDNIDNVTYLGLNDDVIWPGSLVEGNKANDFVYVPISVDRAPVTLSVSLEGSPATGESLTNTVADPKLSTIRQGISDLLKSSITGETRVPAKVEFKYAQIYSQSQMNLFVGADVSYGAGSLDTKFNWDSQTMRNKIIASYKQIYYSIDIDTPKSPSDMLAPTMPVSNIEAAMPAGSMPLYVSSVSYGMMAFVFIETDYSYEDMKWALDAAYDAIVSGSVDLDMHTQQILQQSSIQTVVYGGSTAGLEDLEKGYNGFLNVMKASKDFNSSSPGVPLVYRFRHLSDNTLALITLTSQYTLVKPLRLLQRVRVTVDRFVCTMSDDEGAGNDADMDRFYVWATAYNRWSDTETGSVIGTPEQQVFGWSTSGEWTVGYGGVFDASLHKPNSLDIVFDTEHYDFNKARLVLKAYAREYDSTSGNEQATVYWEITGEHFLDDMGKHSRTIAISGSTCL